MNHYLLSISAITLSLSLIGCNATPTDETNQTTNIEQEETVAENNGEEDNESLSEIAKLKKEAKNELGHAVFIPDMEELKVTNAFVSYIKDKPVQLDIQYHLERGDMDERFKNDMIVEEYKKERGMKYLIPPYESTGNLTFWTMYRNSDDLPSADTLQGEVIDIDGEQAIISKNEQEYKFYIEANGGYYMFLYNLNHFSEEEAMEKTRTFMTKINELD